MAELQDLTKGCLEDLQKQGEKRTELQLRSEFCQRCLNGNCGYAKKGTDNLWLNRILNQENALLINPTFADPLDPRYDIIRRQDFADRTRSALQLAIADQNMDWQIPQMPSISEIFPGSFTEASPSLPNIEPKAPITQKIDEAAQALAASRGKKLNLPSPEKDESVELNRIGGDESFSKAVVKTPPEEPQNPPERAAPLEMIPPPTSSPKQYRNTPMPASGLMLDGSLPYQKADKVVDSWDTPKDAPKIVAVGATIKVGGKK